MIGKITVIVIIGGLFAGGFLPLVQVQATTGGAYQRGYTDAVRDSQGLNGHGYDPSCPGDHSQDYCTNYQSGYSDGWNNNGSTRSVNSEGAAIGGNRINGDRNVINQQIIQQQGPRSVDNNDHNSDGSSGDSSGQLPRCKAFCLGVQ